MMKTSGEQSMVWLSCTSDHKVVTGFGCDGSEKGYVDGDLVQMSREEVYELLCGCDFISWRYDNRKGQITAQDAYDFYASETGCAIDDLSDFHRLAAIEGAVFRAITNWQK